MRSVLLTAVSVMTCVALAGCKARQIGVEFSPVQAASVDNTWLIAANSCWPELTHSGYNLEDVKRYLADPLHFRATFATYSAFSDRDLAKIASEPVGAAPMPDSSVLNHSQNAVLTRTEALQRTNLQGTQVSDNNGPAPVDTLCAIQHGTPVGFR